MHQWNLMCTMHTLKHIKIIEIESCERMFRSPFHRMAEHKFVSCMKKYDFNSSYCNAFIYLWLLKSQTQSCFPKHTQRGTCLSPIVKPAKSISLWFYAKNIIIEEVKLVSYSWEMKGGIEAKKCAYSRHPLV